METGTITNTLWLTKVSLVESSQREIQSWGVTFIPILGTSEEKLTRLRFLRSLPSDLPRNFIMNYEGLNSTPVLDELMDEQFHVVVIDEVHRLKGGANPTPTKIWRNAKKLIRHQIEDNEAFPLFLSGSLVNNKLSEIWAYLNIFDPERFKSVAQFERVFSPTWMQGTGWTPARLIETLAPNMLRRTKKDVAKDLPDKNYMPVEYVDIKENPALADAYKYIQGHFVEELKGMDDDAPLSITAVLAQLHYLRSILVSPGKLKYNYYPVDPDTLERSSEPVTKWLDFSNGKEDPNPKLNAIVDTAQELALQDEGVVIFSAQYNAPVFYIEERLRKLGVAVETLTGQTPNPGEVERKFQQGEIKVLVCNLKAAAEGFNFQRSNSWPGGASHVIFVDRWWNPALNEQGEDRTYRIGTLNPVFIHKFQYKNTVDELIEAIEERKREEAASLTEHTVFRAGQWKELIFKYLK